MKYTLTKEAVQWIITKIKTHINDKNNPHKVTASQVDALPLSGGSLTGNLTAPSFQTGTGGANYFQCRKFRGEGDANNYYHAVDFGYAGHNQIDFYEYGGKYVFHRHREAAQSSGDAIIGEINGNGFVGKVNGHTINADVPAGAKFTDTTYSNATTSVAGLMSPTDKAKLDGIEAGSNVKSVNGKTGAVTLAKGDVGLANVANYDQSKAIKSITRSGTTFTATTLDGTTFTFTQQDTDTTYGVATQSANGLMSASDKSKMDSLRASVYETHSVPITGWTSRTINDTSYVQYSITLTNSYQYPSVKITPYPTGSNPAPTSAELTAFNSLVMYGVDDAGGKTLNLIATAVPSTAFAIMVSGLSFY